jgi:hypothetical protein
MTNYNLTILNEKQIKSKVCYIPISTGQDYHKGQKFRQEISCLCEKFDKLIFVNADSLQRYNIAIKEELSIEKAHEKAIEHGDHWDKVEFQALLNSLPEEYHSKIEKHRWDEYIVDNKQEYLDNLNLINNTYETGKKLEKNKEFYKAVRKAAWQRSAHLTKKINLENFDDEKILEGCINYIKEEDAVFMQWFKQHPQGCLFYPQPNDDAREAIFNCLKVIAGPEAKDFTFLETQTEKLAQQSHNISKSNNKKQKLGNSLYEKKNSKQRGRNQSDSTDNKQYILSDWDKSSNDDPYYGASYAAFRFFASCGYAPEESVSITFHLLSERKNKHPSDSLSQKANTSQNPHNFLANPQKKRTPESPTSNNEETLNYSKQLNN